MIENFPFIVERKNIVYRILGPDIGSLKGKTIGKKYVPVQQDLISVLTRRIIAYWYVMIGDDIMYINKTHFVGNLIIY